MNEILVSTNNTPLTFDGKLDYQSQILREAGDFYH